MNISIKSTAVFLAIAVLTACSTIDAGRGKPVSLDRPMGNTGMIVGHIDDRGAKHKITYITIWETRPMARRGYIGIPVKMLEDGTFIAENVKPGSYYVPVLASGRAVASITDRQVLQPLQVKAGEVRYWGAYAVDFKMGSNTFGIPARMTIAPSTRMSKRQVLQKVLIAAKGSGWEAALRKELARK